MFSIYQTRVRERLDFALAQLESEPDFTVDEEYQFDRSEEPWAKSEAELDEIWRKRVKNDVLRLELADKPWEESQDLLRKRYTRYLKRIDQVKADDVFETFMNAFAHTLDPHSSYLSPRNSEEYRIQMSLSYFGIGASLQLDEDYVQIVNIIPGGPAAIDGKLKPKDRITGVAQGPEGDMVDVIGWRLDDVVDLIRGPANTVVRLQIIPAGALPGASEKTIALTRDQVKLEEGHRGSEFLPRLPRHEQRGQGLYEHDPGCEAPHRRARGRRHRRPDPGFARQRRWPPHRSHGTLGPFHRQRSRRAAAKFQRAHKPPRRPGSRCARRL
jgi:carboxyl-terminal processing protease